jgi:hypothetical protein
MEVRIASSKKEDWYHKFQFKNNKAKTFVVVPNRTFDKFLIMEGEHTGKEIDPEDVHPIKPLEFLKFMRNV